MTQPPDEHGELLRRALRAEADAVVPSPDGLEIIRARIQRRSARNLFWWRAGAAAVSSVLVAATLVLAVPQLRSQIVNQQPVVDVNDETSKVPSNSSTTRSQPPPPSPEPPRQSNLMPVPVETSRTPTARPSRRAESTSKPDSPTPTPTTTVCPSVMAEQAEPPAGCPEITPTPTPTVLDPSVPASTSVCPVEQCPPHDIATETPTPSVSPLVSTPQSTATP
ncbi:hypothetical protein SAMN05421874_101503 [Nonomuraea maritima]|uniref:Uncharacterized protein n=1 Tax=Nonomuraea maritima TaxID=683260 RepID=A0A1G8SZZ5_9ACTN|nr:hypothetical protein [Nonomuraea maritima]SDJ34375.1 hypothetical protein SAMN05421874_101503 [Nonomuraea maritima]